MDDFHSELFFFILMALECIRSLVDSTLKCKISHSSKHVVDDV